jgi:Ser/Thr protein kinase RdoA (MazF antagonist)
MDLSRGEADVLLRTTGGDRAWTVDGVAGAFVVEGDGVRAFVREVCADRAKRLVAADDLARRLARDGITSPLILDGYPRPVPSGRVVVAYPYYAGRYARPDRTDARSLGAELAAFHAALEGVPGKRAIRAAARERRALIASRIESMARGEGSLGPVPETARRHARVWADRIGFESDNAGPAHGDVHQGNFLWLEDDAIAILDLEDVLTTWERPSVDVAAAIERFALVPAGEDVKLAYTLGRAIIEGYARPVIARGELAMQLALRSVKALALLSEVESRGQTAPIAEWRKFSFLLELLELRRDVIADLEASAA